MQVRFFPKMMYFLPKRENNVDFLRKMVYYNIYCRAQRAWSAGARVRMRYINKVENDC